MNMKAFHFSSAALVAVISSLAAFQWADIVDAKTASEIVMGIGTIMASGRVGGRGRQQGPRLL